MYSNWLKEKEHSLFHDIVLQLLKQSHYEPPSPSAKLNEVRITSKSHGTKFHFQQPMWKTTTTSPNIFVLIKRSNTRIDTNCRLLKCSTPKSNFPQKNWYCIKRGAYRITKVVPPFRKAYTISKVELQPFITVNSLGFRTNLMVVKANFHKETKGLGYWNQKYCLNIGVK